MSSILRVMLDSCAFDYLALDEAVRADIEESVAQGRLELVVTHIQIDELNATPSAERRRLLQRLTVIARPTAGLVFGRSRFDMAAFGSEDQGIIFDEVTRGNPRHAGDALILLTAKHEGVPVVTAETTGGFAKRCARHGVEAMHPRRLVELVRDRVGHA